MGHACECTMLDVENEIGTEERVRQAEDIFETHGDEIRAMISLNVREQAAADDMFQDLFLSIVQNPIPTDTDRVAAYLYRIVANDVIDETRRSHNYAEFVRGYRERGNHKETQEAPENDVILLEEVDAALRLLKKQLAYHEVEAVIQKYVCGNKTRDAARKMEVDSKTYSQYLYRGKAKIRQLHRSKGEKQGDKNEYLQQSDKL